MLFRYWKFKAIRSIAPSLMLVDLEANFLNQTSNWSLNGFMADLEINFQKVSKLQIFNYLLI
jgi:hypothetical protein